MMRRQTGSARLTCEHCSDQLRGRHNATAAIKDLERDRIDRRRAFMLL
jgi:hypothetical protein